MTSRILISSIVFLAVALAATPALSGGTPPPPQKTIVEECTENWNKSSASRSCQNVSIVKVLNYRCRVTADCQNSGGGTTRTWKVVERYDSDRLVNCSGHLRRDNC